MNHFDVDAYNFLREMPILTKKTHFNQIAVCVPHFLQKSVAFTPHFCYF
jgi:hypothetical protein